MDTHFSDAEDIYRALRNICFVGTKRAVANGIFY